MNRILVSSMLALIVLTGCASDRIVLHPIDQTDIQVIQAGKSYTFTNPGFYLSQFYMEEVARARVEKSK